MHFTLKNIPHITLLLLISAANISFAGEEASIVDADNQLIATKKAESGN